MICRRFLIITSIALTGIVIHLTLFHNSLAASGKIAVVEGTYDNVETVLKNYRIPYDLIKLRDLNNIRQLNRYTSLFLPSGVEIPLHKKIKLVAAGTRIKSVKLSKDALEADEVKISRNIKTFIEKGGSVYFSGYSYRYLQLAYNLLTFFNNFPYMGMPGRIITENSGDLYRFSLRKRSPLYITFPGWVVVKSAHDADILSTALLNTPRGEKKGPISFVIRKGTGEALFTSYYSTVFSAFRRFNIYRIAGNHLLKKLYDESERYQQSVTGRVADSIQRGEISRTYRFNLKAGNNTLYFASDSNDYRLDIFDKEMSLVLSLESINKDISFDREEAGDTICFVRVYPVSENRYGIYSLISAKGNRYFPYYKTTAVVFAILLLIALAFTFTYLFGGKKYAGRPMKFR